MAWTRLDDGYDTHRKLLELGDGARGDARRWTWTRILLRTNRHGSDIIPAGIRETFPPPIAPHVLVDTLSTERSAMTVISPPEGFVGPELGSTVTELISGYEGIVVGQCRYLWGCDQVLVSRKDEKGKPESEWFDISRVSVNEQASLVLPVVHVKAGAPVAPSGADRPAPIR